MKNYSLTLLLLLLFSCKSEETAEPIDYRARNEADIQAYITENQLDASRTDSGLYYVIDEAGEGAQPSGNDEVTVVYKGYFLNGAVFDQSDAAGLTINLQRVIPGWTEGIPYFKEGGKGMLLIPAHLGYGSYDYYNIPGGSVLLFDVTLVEVIK